MSEIRREAARRLREAVLGSPGELDRESRAAFYARAGTLSGGRLPPAVDAPALLTALADKVALHSYRVTDEDFAALRAAGVSEEVIYETVASAALGAGMARLQYALAALDLDPL